MCSQKKGQQVWTSLSMFGTTVSTTAPFKIELMMGCSSMEHSGSMDADFKQMLSIQLLACEYKPLKHCDRQLIQVAIWFCSHLDAHAQIIHLLSI